MRQRVLLFSVTLLLLALLDLFVGGRPLSVESVVRVLCGQELEGDIATRVIVFDYRLPRLLTALLVGIALPTSGILMQSLFQTPLAGPYVLGISSGASLGSALVILVGGVTFTYWLGSPLGVAIAAMLGAGGVLCLLLIAARQTQSRYALLVIGMLLSAACGAVITLLESLSSNHALRDFVVWTMGSLSGVYDEALVCLTLTTLLGWGLAWASAARLNILQLGLSHAATLGLNVRTTYTLLFVATGVLAGGATAFCGPIGFVGIAIPYLARRLLATSDHRRLLLFTPLVGACGVVMVDLIGAVVGRWVILPLNAMTAVLGIPVVLQMMLGKKPLD